MFGNPSFRTGIGLFLIVVISQIDESSQDCAFSTEWKRELNQIRCRGKAPYLAVIEEKVGRYRSKCCTDEESVEIEREDLEQCETTECLVDRNQRNLCGSLPQYLTDTGNRVEYEVALNDTCRHEKLQRNGTTAVCCPKNSVAGLLVSTSAAEQNEFPHMASTGGCGATVYNRHFVISAAHCFVNVSTGRLVKGPHQVVLGTNIDELKSKTNTYPVAEVIVHEHCSLLEGHPERRRGYRRYYNDLALLRLKRAIDFKKDASIRALEIAPPNFRPERYSEQAVILGWGTTQSGRTSEHLQKANILVREDSLCFDKRRGNLGRKQYEVNEFSEQLLCLGGIVNGSVSNSAGKGDSGGPAICRGRDGRALLCGVASFGSEFEEEKCAQFRNEEYCQPSVYEDIGYFHDWIVRKAGVQDPETLYRAKLYGERVGQERYPHQVQITSKNGGTCGGTLVALDTVVTAAHCVAQDNGEKRKGVRIVGGADEAVYRPIKGGIFYPERFQRYAGLDKLNETKSGRVVFRESAYIDDIAVIKLDREVNGVTRRDVAKLPGKNLKLERAVELAFGREERGSLIEREFNLLSNSECRKRINRLHALGIHVRIPRKIICGVEVYSGGSTCERSLGGGLICEGGKGRDVLCGVQMFRMCEMALPSAFVSVGKYLELIEGVINEK